MCEECYVCEKTIIRRLLNFCENSKDHAVTPNEFMRMPRVRMHKERRTDEAN